MSLQARHRLGIREDFVLCVALIAAQSVYHDLALQVQPGQREQYSYWSSVFGPMDGRLYYFELLDVVAFKEPIEIPVAVFHRLQSFFVELDLRSPARMAQVLRDQGVDLPPWFDENDHLCLRMPSAFAYMASIGAWQSLAVPNPRLDYLFHRQRRERSTVVGWKCCLQLQSDFPAVPRSAAQEAFREEPLPLTARNALEAADVIRALAQKLNLQDQGPEGRLLLDQCRQAACVLQSFHDQLDPVSMQHGALEMRGRAGCSKLPYQAHFLVQCMMLTYHMRDAAALKKVLARAVQVVVPRAFAHAILEPLQDGTMKIPSASTLSRARLTTDVAFMLSVRSANARQSDNVVRYVMVDSSVQGHHDLELIRCVCLDTLKAEQMFHKALDLFQLWREPEQDPAVPDAERVREERDLMASIADGLSTHLLPSVVLGGGHTSLWHKYHAVAHAMWLETGAAPLLETFSKSVFAFTTDQGVETGLCKVPILRASSVLPWMPVPEDEAGDHDWAPAADLAGQHYAAVIDFTQAVGVPGMLHIVHNSTNDLSKAVQHFDEIISQMTALSRLLRKRDSKARLLETCFSDHVGRFLQDEIRRFSAKLHTGRWGTIAACVEELLQVEAPLRFGWDLAKFGRNRQQEDSVDVAVVDAAVKSSFFWGFLHMLKILTDVVQTAMHWSESCPCHWGLDRRIAKVNKLQKQWLSCPLKGCRGPELASGGFLEVLRDLAETSAGQLLTQLPRDVGPAERATLLQEFERGRAHLLFVLSMRLEHWRHEPWKAFACGHFEDTKRKEAFQECLSMRPSHPLLQELHQPAMADEARQYITGAQPSVHELPLLSSFMAKLAFCPTAERAVEGDHAQVP